MGAHRRAGNRCRGRRARQDGHDPGDAADTVGDDVQLVVAAQRAHRYLHGGVVLSGYLVGRELGLGAREHGRAAPFLEPHVEVVREQVLDQIWLNGVEVVGQRVGAHTVDEQYGTAPPAFVTGQAQRDSVVGAVVELLRVREGEDPAAPWRSLSIGGGVLV